MNGLNTRSHVNRRDDGFKLKLHPNGVYRNNRIRVNDYYFTDLVTYNFYH